MKNKEQKARRLEVIKCPDSTYFETVLAHEYGHAIEVKLLELVNKWDVCEVDKNTVNDYMYMKKIDDYIFESKEYDLIEICIKS